MNGEQAFPLHRGLVTKSASNLGRAVLACILLGAAALSSMAQDAQPVQTAQISPDGQPAQPPQTTAQPAQSAQPQAPANAAALAQARKDAQNPIASMISLPIQENWNFNIGPADRVQNVMNIQPVLRASLRRSFINLMPFLYHRNLDPLCYFKPARTAWETCNPNFTSPLNTVK
jgi:cell division septation protein DedD